MARYLVVAHQTAASFELLSAIQDLASQEKDAEFVLLVPATPVKHLLTWTEGEAEAVARATATEAARALRDAGLNLIESVVGPPDPLRAIQQEHQSRRSPYSATIISTLPLGISRWLRRDLPNRVRAKLGVDVVHVVTNDPAKRPAVA